MNVLSLFAGIGGIDLGLERLGCHTVAHAEVDDYASRVFARHFPDSVPLGDVTGISWAETFEDTGPPDIICGGFPCQDISSANTAGARKGLHGSKSGLWRHMRNAIDALRPRGVLIENSPEWRRWMPSVRRELHALGYASLPLRVSAADVGAPHRRPRGFVVAYTDRDGQPRRALDAEVAGLQPIPRRSAAWRAAAPSGVGVGDGIPHRLDRLRCLGNAVVPQVAEHVGRILLDRMEGSR